jgi:hypothetical protein
MSAAILIEPLKKDLKRFCVVTVFFFFLKRQPPLQRDGGARNQAPRTSRASSSDLSLLSQFFVTCSTIYVSK